MGFARPAFAAAAAASVMAAASAHALVVHFDPPLFDFFVTDPASGPQFVPLSTVEVTPLDVPGSFGYKFPGVDWVGFGTDGETLTFGADDAAIGGYQLVAPFPLWTVTGNPNTIDEVTFVDKSQVVQFTNPATGQVVDVGITVGVPEPATWALMLLGISSLGVALRNRRRSAAVAV